MFPEIWILNIPRYFYFGYNKNFMLYEKNFTTVCGQSSGNKIVKHLYKNGRSFAIECLTAYNAFLCAEMIYEINTTLFVT